MEWSIKNTADWAPYRDEIFNLYFDEEWALERVRKHMKQKHGLKASERRYKWLINVKNSGRSKNIPVKIWNYIVSAIRARQTQGKQSQVRWHGSLVDTERMQRELARYNPNLRNRSHSTGALPTQVEILTPPATRCCTPTLDFAFPAHAVISSSAEESSLFVPEDAMSENDYGSLEVITHELLLNGIPVFGRAHKTFPEILSGFVPRCLNYSWSWELLMGILETAILSGIGQLVPGFPVTASELLSCSKLDLLNMAINAIVSFDLAFREAQHIMKEIFSWFLHDFQDHMLSSIFLSQNERIVPFSRKLLRASGELSLGIKPPGPNMNTSKLLHVMRIAFSKITSFSHGHLSEEGVSSIFLDISSLDVPDMKLELINRVGKIEFPKIDSVRFLSLLSAKSWKSAMLTMRHLSVNDEIRKTAFRNMIIKYCSQDDPHSMPTPFSCDLSTINFSEAMFDKLDVSIFPSTNDGYLTLCSSQVVYRVMFHLHDPLSLEICQSLARLSADLHTVHRTQSPFPREFILLGSARFDNASLAKSFVDAGTDLNCPRIRTQLAKSKLKHPGSRIVFFFSLENFGLKNIFQVFLEATRQCCYLESSLGWDKLGLIPTSITRSTFYQSEEDVEFLKLLVPILLRPNYLLSAVWRLLYLVIVTNDTGLLLNIRDAILSQGRQAIWKADILNKVLKFSLTLGSIEIIKLLWNMGARLFVPQPHSTELEKYPKPGFIEFFTLFSSPYDESWQEKIEFLLERGACVNATTSISPCDTPLQSFIRTLRIANSKHKKAYLEIVKLFLLNKADANSFGSSQESPLQLASAYGRFDIMKCLLKHGADINLTRGSGLSPLAYACSTETFVDFGKSNQPQIVHRCKVLEFLLDKGADPNKGGTPKTFRTPLAVSCGSGSLDSFCLLVQRGADIHLSSFVGSFCGVDGFAETPLQAACRRTRNIANQAKIVQFLLENGAEIDAQIGYKTALQHASSWGNFNLVLLLLKHGANIELTASDDKTALMLAAERGHFDIIKLLLNAGAEKDVGIDRFSRAISLARRNGHVDISHYLESLQDFTVATFQPSE